MKRFDFSNSNVDGKVVMVTGGTGSFGQRFVRRLLTKFSPAKVIVFSRDEAKQHDMAMNLMDRFTKQLRFFIGDVRDSDRLEMAMRETDVVVHAAALKQVPAAEYNPFECIKTNVYGAENVVNAALKCGVDRVIALSTDKAASPINLYGASKLASDKIFVAANHLSGGIGTRFSVVRYGNVVGSRGSIVPLFRRMVAEGATELPITDARMTRFWITLDQGVDFVLSNLALMQGGEIFVPRIPSMRVVDVAAAIGPGLPFREIGVRPGEKLHEAMITSDDARCTWELPDRYVIEPSLHFWDKTGYDDLGAQRVPDEFAYTSDHNDEWIDPEAFRAMLETLDRKD
jgi:UDP-N-acetylglucosamine 4,6-dehydratase